MTDSTLGPHEAGRDDFLKQVGRAVLQWQNVENALATLCAAMFRPKNQDQWNAIEALMHTLMAKAKIDAIEAAAKHALKAEAMLQEQCLAILTRARKLAKKRNDAAHSTWMIAVVSVTDTRDGSESFEIGDNLIAPHPLGRRKGDGAKAFQIEADADAFAAFALEIYALASQIDPRGRLIPPPDNEHATRASGA